MTASSAAPSAGGRDRPGRVVVKVGTSLLTKDGCVLDRAFMERLVAQLVAVRHAGWQVVLVTSGAIAAGRSRLPLDQEQKDIPSKQVLASVGQPLLMQEYEKLFAPADVIVAQALLTKHDLCHRIGYRNARNTLLALLKRGMLPVVNENDVVAVDELPHGERFGDNDTLSAMVANVVQADLLLILSDIAGLYTADPHKDSRAILVPEVAHIDDDIERMARGTSSQHGTGGMLTKLDAARIATASGVTVWITHGQQPDIVPRLLASGHEHIIGTRFPTNTRPKSKHRWILSALVNRAAVHVDAGAVTALLERGRSLLPVGVQATQGRFDRRDPVSLVGPDGHNLACGLANYAAADVARIKGLRSDRIAAVLGHTLGDEVVHRDNLVILNGTPGT